MPDVDLGACDECCGGDCGDCGIDPGDTVEFRVEAAGAAVCLNGLIYHPGRPGIDGYYCFEGGDDFSPQGTCCGTPYYVRVLVCCVGVSGGNAEFMATIEISHVQGGAATCPCVTAGIFFFSPCGGVISGVGTGILEVSDIPDYLGCCNCESICNAKFACLDGAPITILVN